MEDEELEPEPGRATTAAGAVSRLRAVMTLLGLIVVSGLALALAIGMTGAAGALVLRRVIGS